VIGGLRAIDKRWKQESIVVGALTDFAVVKIQRPHQLRT
jgi:hypothetical protein